MAKRKSSKTVKTRSEIARNFGVSERSVATWLSSGCPGKPGKYDLQAIAAWRRGKVKKEAASSETWKERFQKEKAKIARLDRLRREGQLIDRSVALTCWAIIARRIQQVGSSLQKLFGPSAAKMLNEAIEDCKREVAASFPNDSNDQHSDAK